MTNLYSQVPANWQDWLTVFSYVGFTVFVIVCILIAQKN